jgi:hypothetical protein
MENINYIALLVASLAQFALGALWYSPLMFGKWWMEIMEATHFSKEELQKLQKEMTPFYALQLLLTLVTTWVLATNLAYGNVFSGGTTAVLAYAFFMWLGYVMPTQVSTVIWGRTKRMFWAKQLCVMLTYSFVGIMLGAWILVLFA